MLAVCREWSSFTSRRKCRRMDGPSRWPLAMTCCTTCRTRLASSRPFTRQNRYSCLAARLAFLVILTLHRDLFGGFLGQPPLVFCGQDLAGDGSGGVHHQLAHLA